MEPIPTEATVQELPTQPPTTEPVICAEASIFDVPVNGLTKLQALEAVRAALPEYHSESGVTLSIGEHTLSISSEDINVHWDVERAVDAAIAGTVGSIPLELTMDTEALTQVVQRFFEELGGIYLPSGYWLEGEAPDLDQLSDSRQTLVINTGSPGYSVDLQELCQRIQDAFLENQPQVTVDSLGEFKEPGALDIQQIFNQVSILPVNPRVDPATLEVIPGRVGYGFDQERVCSLLSASKSGETLRIPMEYLQPASEEEAWFQDTLGYCKTEYTDNENRNENLRLACSKLNGLILQPGEVLSYNQLLGKRTTEAGYKPAPAYVGTELMEDIGGGICQVSSTLYLSSLFAELTVVERRNHGYPVSYIPLGLDATVNWGTTDLKLRNDYELPVKILAEVSDGYVKIRIMGVEQRDYYVKMEYRVDDHPDYAAAFRCRYDRETDEQIYRALDHTSIYLEDVWCNPGYAQSDTDEP